MSILVLEIRLAVRNVMRQRRRSAVAIAAIAFGVIALMLAGGFIDWILMAMRESTIHAHIGHVQIVRPGYRDKGIADPYRFLLPETSTEQSEIDRLPQVKVVGARLAFSGLISHGESTVGFVGDGVEPDKELLLSSDLNVVQGEALSETDPQGIILGKGLATTLGIKVGDTAILLANTERGGINAVECTVRGLFTTVTKAYDDSALRVPVATARKLLRVSGSHVWVALLNDTEQTSRVLAELRTRYGGKSLEFVPWSELADYYNKTASLFKRQVGVIKLIIGLVIVLSISNTLMMNVLERTGEIGTAMALGLRRSSILRRFLLEGAVLGLLGGVIGVALGTILSFVISWIGIPMPPAPGMETGYTAEILASWRLTADAVALAVGTTLIAGLYPSWKASRMNVVDALRVNR